MFWTTGGGAALRAPAVIGSLLIALSLSIASLVLDSLFRTETGLSLGLAASTIALTDDVPIPTSRVTSDLSLDGLMGTDNQYAGLLRVRWSGVWHTADATVVDFYMAANRARLEIDGRPFVSTGAMEVETVAVDAGFHQIQIDYTQVGSRPGMYLQWAPTGEIPRRFDPDALFPTEPSENSFATSRRLLTLRRLASLAWLLPMGAIAWRFRKPWKIGSRRPWGIGGLVFVAAFAGYLATARHLKPAVFSQQNAVFSADTESTVNAIVFGPTVTRSADHLLFLGMRPLVRAIQTAAPFNVSMNEAILLALALLAAVNCVLMYLTVGKLVDSWPLAGLFATLYGLALANLVLFSVPETYALATFTVLLYLFAATTTDPARMGNAVLFGVLAALAGLANIPLLSLSLIYVCIIACTTGARQMVRLGATSAFTTTVCFVGGYLLATSTVSRTGAGSRPLAINGLMVDQATATLSNVFHGAGAYTSWGHFSDIGAMGTTVVSFLCYSVVAPLATLTYSLELADVVGYIGSILGIAVFVAYVGFQSVALGTAARAREPVIRAGLLWLATMVLFHVYVNPEQAILYAVQVVPILILLSARQFSRVSFSLKYVVLMVWMGLLAYRNVSAVYAAIGVD